MALLIYSGGLDSTVLLYKLAAERRLAGALTINYGQRHSKEIEFARRNCERLGVKWDMADISNLGPIFGENSLTSAKVAVPDGHYEDATMKITVVPNRNMLLISIAAARAIALNCDSVAYAAHSGDHAIYPDCRNEFADAMDAALRLCHYYPIKLERPFMNKTKGEIVKLGAELGVDFSQTWSCYKGGEIHCGTCGTCVERREAFERAGVKDPTIYREG